MNIDGKEHGWRLKAACAPFVAAGYDYWFGKYHINKARAICATCPVIQQCEAFIRETPDIRDGIWAGRQWFEYPGRLFKAKWNWYANRAVKDTDINIISSRMVMRLTKDGN